MSVTTDRYEQLVRENQRLAAELAATARVIREARIIASQRNTAKNDYWFGDNMHDRLRTALRHLEGIETYVA